MNTHVFRTAGLLAVLALLSFYKFVYPGDAPQVAATAMAASPIRPADRGNHGIAVDYSTVPQSGWLKRLRVSAARRLENTDAALLVVPVQGDKNAFDPIERALITRLLNERIMQVAPESVPDTAAVLGYLGTNRPSFASTDIRSLATLVNAEHILVLHAEHDRKSTWQLRATLKTTDDHTKDKTKTWTKLTFGDASLPSENFLQIVDDVVAFATGKKSRPSLTRTSFTADEFDFPADIEDLTARSGASPLHAAAYLQLLAALHPRGDFNEFRNHLFERSLTELSKVSPDVAFHRYFKARAYAYLDRRPAAIALIGRPRNKQESALLAALNGNLTELTTHVAGNAPSAFHFLALKDLQKVESWAGVNEQVEFMDQYTEKYPAWGPFLFRSIADYEDWANYSAATTKFGLDELLPSSVIRVDDFIEKKAVIGDFPDEVDLTRLLWEHIEAIEEDLLKADLSESRDVLDLAKATAVANHIREIREDLEQRVIPSAALDEISDYETIYADHPAVTLLKARALKALYDESTGAEKNNLRVAADKAYAAGFAWTGSLTVDAVEVARGYARHSPQHNKRYPGRQSPFFSYSRRYFEWPRNSAWHRYFPAAEVNNGAIEECAEYTWTIFECLRWSIDRVAERSDSPDEVRTKLFKENEHRFVGLPRRDQYAVELARQSMDKDAEIRELETRIRQGSKDLGLYYSLGRIYKRRGEYQKAQEAWLSYPDFEANGGATTVSDARHADTSAAMLYWIGQYELAIPLLELAAGGSTGSASEMTSSARLALLNGDLETAAAWQANRVRRYDSKYGLRDFLQLMHILGNSELSWNTFDQFQSVDQNSQMWSGALVGHRIEKATTQEIVDWLKSSKSRREAESRNAANVHFNLASRYLLMAGTMDRVPGETFGKLVADVNPRPLPILRRPRGTSNFRSDFDQSGELRLRDGRQWIDQDAMIPVPNSVPPANRNDQVDHRYTMLAEAMSAFLRDDFAEAYSRFSETAHYYLLDEYLVYYAYSAAMIEQGNHLQAALEAREPRFAAQLRKEGFNVSNLGYRFDEDLAYAVLAAFSGDHQESLSRIRQALNNRPYLDDRSVYPMYQIVDLAERLHEQTGETGYKDLALDLARRHTVVLPMYSWAYFVVAKLSPSESERIEAAASGLHLDALSWRGSQLDDALLTKARTLLKTKGAPYLSSGGATKSGAT